MKPTDVDPRYFVERNGNVFGPKSGNHPLKAYHTGYNGQVSVKINGKNYRVSRLVALAYIPNPENKPEVAHNNGDCSDNRVENLRWATHMENMSDTRKHGTLVQGEKFWNAKLTEEEVAEIRHLRLNKVHVDEVASKYGVSRWTIYDACNPMRTWKGADY